MENFFKRKLELQEKEITNIYELVDAYILPYQYSTQYVDTITLMNKGIADIYRTKNIKYFYILNKVNKKTLYDIIEARRENDLSPKEEYENNENEYKQKIKKLNEENKQLKKENKEQKTKIEQLENRYKRNDTEEKQKKIIEIVENIKKGFDKNSKDLINKNNIDELIKFDYKNIILWLNKNKELLININIIPNIKIYNYDAFLKFNKKLKNNENN